MKEFWNSLQPRWQSAIKRFIRIFIISGLVGVGAIVTPNLAVNGWDDLRSLLFVALLAFLNGGLAGIEKFYRWKPENL